MGKKYDKARIVPEHKLTKTHSGHGKHMCSLVGQRKMDIVASLAKDSRYICHVCGRAAAKADNLCEAVKI